MISRHTFTDELTSESPNLKKWSEKGQIWTGEEQKTRFKKKKKKVEALQIVCRFNENLQYRKRPVVVTWNIPTPCRFFPYGHLYIMSITKLCLGKHVLN